MLHITAGWLGQWVSCLAARVVQIYLQQQIFYRSFTEWSTQLNTCFVRPALLCGVCEMVLSIPSILFKFSHFIAKQNQQVNCNCIRLT